MRNIQCRTFILAKNLKNMENETQTQYDIMRNPHCRTWSMTKNLKIIENEKLTG